MGRQDEVSLKRGLSPRSPNHADAVRKRPRGQSQGSWHRLEGVLGLLLGLCVGHQTEDRRLMASDHRNSSPPSLEARNSESRRRQGRVPPEAPGAPPSSAPSSKDTGDGIGGPDSPRTSPCQSLKFITFAKRLCHGRWHVPRSQGAGQRHLQGHCPAGRSPCSSGRDPRGRRRRRGERPGGDEPLRARGGSRRPGPGGGWRAGGEHGG